MLPVLVVEVFDGRVLEITFSDLSDDTKETIVSRR
jgi:hypothetical protein